MLYGAMILRAHEKSAEVRRWQITELTSVRSPEYSQESLCYDPLALPSQCARAGRRACGERVQLRRRPTPSGQQSLT